jgi:TonB-linked SusC/RagA family outer membrane protein
MPARPHAVPTPAGDRAARRAALLLALAPAALAGAGPARAAAQPPGAAAETQRITGRVTNAGTGAPLEGVTVRVPGTAAGASTDARGDYRLVAPAGARTLVFARIGMTRQEVPIGGRAQINVALQPTATSLEGVTVIGYQTVATERLTGAIVQVDTAQIQTQARVQNSPFEALQGRVAGVSVQGQTGDPNNVAAVRIRGQGTLPRDPLNAASDPTLQPLYVIDGIPTKGNAIQQLKADDIETIQVLKDAATASIYGSRASNGVIVVTTKRGAAQGTRVTAGTQLTSSTYPARPSVLNTEGRGRALFQAAVNDGVDPGTLPIYDYEYARNPDGSATLTRVIVPRYVGDSAAGILASDTDWYREISRTGLNQQHTAQAATTGERGSALLSLGYFGDQGIVRGTSFNRLNGRVNSSFSLFGKRLTLGENLSISRTRGRPIATGLGGTVLDLGLIAQPILPVRTVSGAYAGPLGAGFDDRDNPVMLIDLASFNQNTGVQALGNLFAQLAVTPNLQANARLGVDYNDGQGRTVLRRYRAGFLSRNVNSLTNTGSRTQDWTFNGTLNYGRLLGGRHNVTLLGGVEAVSSTFTDMRTYRENFAVETLEYFVANAGTGLQSLGGDRGEYALASFFGKADYDYRNRYLATFTLRRDGSSRFGANNRYGVFPALTLGWRVSEEPFFPRGGAVSELKLRFGRGRTGNQEIANYAQYALYVSGYGDPNINSRFFNPSNGTAYDVRGQNSGTLPSGFLRTQTANPDLRWEQTDETNGGLDFGLFGNRLTGSVDYFDRTTSNILINPPYAAVIGNGGAQFLNGATLKVRGAELAARYERTVGAVTLGLQGNASGFRPRITRLPAAVVGSYPGNGFQTILGRSPNSIFGYVVQGIFQDSAEVAAAAAQPGKRVGRLRYEDLNGDRRIDALDQRYLGTTDARVEYGLAPSASFRRLSVSLLVQGVAGRKVYNTVKAQTDFTSNFTGANFSTRVLRAWTPRNRGSTIPALTLANTNDEFRSSTYFVESGGYVKLREVVVGYTLPQGSLPGALSALGGSRLFLRGGNLLTAKGRGTTLPDPELPFSAFPIPRTFTVGLDLSR